MISFTKLVDTFFAQIKKMSSELRGVLSNFKERTSEDLYSYNTKRIDGCDGNNFALNNHTHDYVLKNRPAHSTLKLNSLLVDNLVKKNHSHKYIQYTELKNVMNEQITLIPVFHSRFKQVIPIGTDNVLTDGQNYYITVITEQSGLEFVYDVNFGINYLVDISFVVSKPNCTLQISLDMLNEIINIELTGTGTRLSITTDLGTQEVEQMLSGFRIAVSYDNGIKIQLYIGDQVLYEKTSSAGSDVLHSLKIIAFSEQTNLVRFSAPDIYVLKPDESQSSKIVKYITINDAQRLNYRTKESFAKFNHDHEGIYERNIEMEQGKRISRNANFYAQNVTIGDVVVEDGLLMHPLEIFAQKGHTHYNEYARRNQQIAKASRLYTNEGLIDANAIAKVEHEHDYATTKTTQSYATKFQKSLQSTTVLTTQKLKVTLIRYIQQFKIWTNQLVEFYSAKHLPKSIFTSDGTNPFPEMLPNTNLSGTSSPEWYSETTTWCTFFPQTCRSARYGPSRTDLVAPSFSNLIKLETFWENPTNPANKVKVTFRKIDGIIEQYYTPSRYHVAYVSKQKYEQISKYSRGKLILDTNTPVKKQANLTFYESIVTSAEKAKESALNVMPSVITETDGAYWVAVLPPKVEESNDPIERIIRLAIGMVDMTVYMIYALLLTLVSLLQFTILQIHKFVVNVLGMFAYETARLSDNAPCICGLTTANLILDLANLLWDIAVKYWSGVFFVPSVSVKYEGGLVPVVFYRTRPSPQYTSSNADYLDEYPINPLSPEEYPGTIGINQGYGTTVGYVKVPISDTYYAYIGAFAYVGNSSSYAYVRRFAENYVRYFGVLGKYSGIVYDKYSARIGSTKWAVLVSNTPYSAQEVGFGVMPTRDEVTVMNSGHPFNLLIMQKGE